ncbi:MAG: hypothetical protein A2Y40_06750 [Candidatus Margulisbacteria bacterium GWF2_35_9]|nr:MAG: hypothetical protein A2Y40_06750 [Candidatus Margulisbacteria bacterium GWF2_35_9]
MLNKVISTETRKNHQWITKTELNNFVKNHKIMSIQVREHKKFSSILRNKTYTLVGALGMTIESQNQEVASLTKKIFNLQSASYENTGASIDENTKEIKNIKEIISELYSNSGFDHNNLYLNTDYISTIDQYSPWVHVVHMKLTLLYFCVSLLLHSDKKQMDKILSEAEKLMNDLLIENIPFAPCINNFIAYPTVVLLILFPESLSSLIHFKLSSFLLNTKQTPVQDIEKDKIHYIKKLLKYFLNIKNYSYFLMLRKTIYSFGKETTFFQQTPIKWTMILMKGLYSFQTM